MPLTQVQLGMMDPVAQYYSFKNRIINGNMRIDQRNAGASVTVNTSLLVYAVDRCYSFALGAAISAQRVSSGRTDFPFALRLTGASGNTYAECGQRIESFNSADLVDSNVTVSFLAARSSGTSLTVRIYYANASDNFNSVTSIASQTLTITSTLAQYTVTFNALPSQVANGIQISLEFGALGAGVTATITALQLEEGSTATSFDYRDYGRELAMAQRYYQKSWNQSAAVPTATHDGGLHVLSWGDGNAAGFIWQTAMRAAPTVTFYPTNSTTAGSVNSGGTDRSASAFYPSERGISYIAVTSGTANTYTRFQWAAAAEL